MKPPHTRPMPGPFLRQCGNPACLICSRNVPGEAIDSGHPAGEESFASLLLGAAILFAAFVLAFVLLPA